MNPEIAEYYPSINFSNTRKERKLRTFQEPERSYWNAPRIGKMLNIPAHMVRVYRTKLGMRVLNPKKNELKFTSDQVDLIVSLHQLRIDGMTFKGALKKLGF